MSNILPFKTKEMREFDKYVQAHWEELLRKAREDWDFGSFEIAEHELHQHQPVEDE